MALHEDDTIRICENPLYPDHMDVIWKRRDTFTAKEYRSRPKPATVETKLKPYNGKATNENKLKDNAIDYSYIDEYCKVSGPVKHRVQDESRPRELITSTHEFGRQKVPFDRFVRHHIGGDGMAFGTQSMVADGSMCQPVQRTTTWGNADNNESTPLRGCYGEESITLTCCGQNVETLVDYGTCMFCVKGLFYHCAEESSCSDTVLDNPCSCSPVSTGCVSRWSMLGLLSVFLPCLMCYPMARGCTAVCKSYKEGESRRKTRQTRTVQNRERERPT